MTKKRLTHVAIFFMVLSSSAAFAMMGSMGGGGNHMDNQQHEEYMNTQQHDQHMTDQNSYQTYPPYQSTHQDMVKPNYNQDTISHEYMDHETMDSSGSHYQDAERFFKD